MFENKLTKEDLEELIKRNELVNQYSLITQALELQKQIYCKKLLSKYKLDTNQTYNIDIKTGKFKKIIKEVEE